SGVRPPFGSRFGPSFRGFFVRLYVPRVWLFGLSVGSASSLQNRGANKRAGAESGGRKGREAPHPCRSGTERFPSLRWIRRITLKDSMGSSSERRRFDRAP